MEKGSERSMGSPKNWKIDAGQEEEVGNEQRQGFEDEEEFSEIPMGTRTGDRRSLYLRKNDFSKYGFTPGCRGCMDVASGKQRAMEALAPHTRACRSRFETCIQEREPDRWAQYLRRRGVEVPPADPEQSLPAASSGSGGQGQHGEQSLV